MSSSLEPVSPRPSGISLPHKHLLTPLIRLDKEAATAGSRSEIHHVFSPRCALTLLAGGSMTSHIQSLPTEILLIIARELNLDDFFNLSFTCRQFAALVYDVGACRAAIQKHIPFAYDWISPTTPAKPADFILRTIFKRRLAVSTARPYTAAIVAKASSFIFTCGVLVYIADSQLRILDTKNPTATETVLAYPALLCSHVDAAKCRVTPVYCAHGIVSCLHTAQLGDAVSYQLQIIDVARRRLISRRQLASNQKLFVRNNARFLVYGSHSEMSSNRLFLRWALYVLDLETGTWNETKRLLNDAVGDGLGVDIDFDIVGDYFYAVTSITAFNGYMKCDASSNMRYTALRFLLRDPSFQNLEETRIFRRKHMDGPIDERFSRLAFELDEATGHEIVKEQRREWLVSKGGESRRGCFRQRVLFPSRQPPREGHDEGTHGAQDTGLDDGNNHAVDIATNVTMTTASDGGSDNVDDANDVADHGNVNHIFNLAMPLSASVSTINWSTVVQNTLGLASSDLSSLLSLPIRPGGLYYDDRIVSSSNADLNPDAVLRKSHSLLPVDELCEATQQPYRVQDVHVKGYHSSSQTFVDLVDDRMTANPSHHKLRIRSICRDTSAEFCTSYRLSSFGEPTNTVSFWPPLASSSSSSSSSSRDVRTLLRILNPPTRLSTRKIDAVFDDRQTTLVYAVEPDTTLYGDENRRFLVLVTFDPSVHLAGLPKWHLRETESGGHPPASPDADVGVGAASMETRPDQKKSKGPWRTEKAAYLTIAQDGAAGTTFGFDFSR